MFIIKIDKVFYIFQVFLVPYETNALTCYSCSGLSCSDPFNAVNKTKLVCSSGENFCSVN
jgi:hypothetical protein